jgi:hypothetical protein
MNAVSSAKLLKPAPTHALASSKMAASSLAGVDERLSNVRRLRSFHKHQETSSTGESKLLLSACGNVVLACSHQSSKVEAFGGTAARQSSFAPAMVVHPVKKAR